MFHAMRQHPIRLIGHSMKLLNDFGDNVKNRKPNIWGFQTLFLKYFVGFHTISLK